MDRNEYIEMCRVCSILPKSVYEIPKSIRKDQAVMCDGSYYYPKSYTIQFNHNGKIMHIATLHSLTANSEISVDLSKVKKVEG